jgi:hypothetical protein
VSDAETGTAAPGTVFNDRYEIVGPLERRDGWLGGGRREQHRVPGRGGEGADPIGEQRPQRAWHWQRGVGVRGQRLIAQRSRDLEGVQRVAARRGLDPDERKPRKGSAQPLLEQVVKAGQRQRTDLETLDPVAGDRLDEPACAVVVGARRWTVRDLVRRGPARDD